MPKITSSYNSLVHLHRAEACNPMFLHTFQPLSQPARGPKAQLGAFGMPDLL